MCGVICLHPCARRTHTPVFAPARAITYSLLNLQLILFNHAKFSSFINRLQHFEDNLNAFSFENFRVRWHTIIYDFFAFLNTQPEDFCLLTISRSCLKKGGRKVAPNQTSCQKLTGSALLCLAGVEWVLGQIRRWMADISNVNFQGLWCQSSTQKWAWFELVRQSYERVICLRVAW